MVVPLKEVEDAEIVAPLKKWCGKALTRTGKGEGKHCQGEACI